MKRIWFPSLMCVCLGIPSDRLVGQATIEGEVLPEAVLRTQPVQMLLHLRNLPLNSDLILTIQAPTGTTVRLDGSAVSDTGHNSLVVTKWHTNSLTMDLSYSVGLIEGSTARGTRKLVVAVANDSAGSSATLSSIGIPILLRPEISFLAYFGFGLLGIALGYLIRFLLKVKNGVVPPSPAPIPDVDQGGMPGSVTQFVTKHYYAVECACTLLLGFIAMAVLAKDGTLPDSATNSSGALIMGLALGLLTDGELLAKAR